MSRQKKTESGSNIIIHASDKIHISAIETELESLWGQFNQSINKGQTVMRACMSNLIVYCDTPIEAKVIHNELASIVLNHPSRVLLLVGKCEQLEQSMQAYVSIYYTKVSDGLQICGERIDIHSTPQKTTRLPSIARSQLIGDLPTTLWWASEQTPPDAGDAFFELAALADQVIYDNIGWVNPIKGVATMTSWVASQQDKLIVYNLAWRKLAVWRKLISQILDPMVAPQALNTINRIEIDHGPHALVMSWLFVGWLSYQLKWQPVDGKQISGSQMIWQFKKNTSDIKVIANRLPEGTPLIYRLSFDWMHAGQKGHIHFDHLDQERIGISETKTDSSSRVFTSQIPTRTNLIAAQLAHRKRDKIFENALTTCNKMAELVHK